MIGADNGEQKVLLDQALDLLKSSDLSKTPPEIGAEIHRLVREQHQDGDPYGKAKEASTRHALACYPRLKERVREAADRLDAAVRLSIAGNIIDLGPDQRYDLWSVVERVLEQPFAAYDMAAFREALAATDRVLYLADNAGETVFDRVLIESLDRPVVYAVKGGPVLNDATLEDALAAGVDRVAEIVDTGSDAPGTILERCSGAFRHLYDSAEMVIAKGQANYETLSEAGPKVFFLLQTKCPVIARDAGAPVGSILLWQGRASREEER
jgi:uncharacterized protein with ATP-grasp and redox domains